MRRFVLSLTACLLSGVSALALDLVKDGKPASVIAIPDAPTEVERAGAETLARYLKLASGAEVAVVKESPKLQGTVVSLGKTELARAAGVTDKGLKYDGYRMVVKGRTLYLLGRDTKLAENRAGALGSLSVVFGFLDRLGFRWLQPTPMGIHVPELKTVTVPNDLNVSHTPPFMYVHGRFVNQGDWSLANSFRSAVRIYTAGGHTWVYGVPAKLYDEHPEYFIMINGKRVKPTQENNPQYCPSNPDLHRLIAEWATKQFDKGYEIVALGQSDGFQACQCPQCAKLSPADQVHNAQRRIIELVGRTYPGRKVQLLIYNPTQHPPTGFKTYPPNTMTEVCLNEMTMRAFENSHDKAMDYWAKAVPGGLTVYVYYMGLYYDNGLAPRFIPSQASERIKNWLGHGVQGIYWCGGNENWGGEGPTYYTIGRLATDPTLDPKKVYEEYITLTFRKAAPAMKQYYDLLYDRLEAHRNWLDDWIMAGVGSGPDETFASLYSADTLLKLQRYLETARQQAAGDTRALGWVRLAEIAFNHYALITRAFHFYRAYMLNPAAQNLKQVGDAVKAYQAWADEVIQIPQKDKAFADNFFPSIGLWATPRLKTNHGHLDCPPFNWDFETKQPGTR